MIRVLFMVPCFSQGGVEHSLITAVQNLPENKYDITLFIRTKETKLVPELPSHVHVIVNESTHFYRYPLAVVYQFLIKIFSFLKLSKSKDIFQERLNRYIHKAKISYPFKTTLKNKKYDVVVAYTVDDCVEMAIKVPAKRRIVFYHTSCVSFMQSTMDDALPIFDSVVACGPGVFNELIKAFPMYMDKIKLLSNYVDREELLNKSNSGLPEKYENLINGRFIICTCGRVAPMKRYDLAIEAAYILKKRGLDYIWFLVGGGNDQAKYEKMISDLNLSDNVIITGNADNPYPFIGICDVYVQTSEFEAQPLAIIEALKLGRPVVSTKTLGGVTILENGDKGVLTEISGEGIAEGIIKMHDDTELRLSFSNIYIPETDKIEKEEYSEKWNDLLS